MYIVCFPGVQSCFWAALEMDILIMSANGEDVCFIIIWYIINAACKHGVQDVGESILEDQDIPKVWFGYFYIIVGSSATGVDTHGTSWRKDVTEEEWINEQVESGLVVKNNRVHLQLSTPVHHVE